MYHRHQQFAGGYGEQPYAGQEQHFANQPYDYSQQVHDGQQQPWEGGHGQQQGAPAGSGLNAVLAASAGGPAVYGNGW